MPEESFVELIKKVLDKSLSKGKTSHRTELFIISLKSLFPLEDKESVTINYDRYNREFSLWKYYKESSNEALNNILFNFDSELYRQGDDDSIIYRLIPIIFTNSIYENIYEELVKNILYTTGNMDKIVESILIGKLIYLLLNGYDSIESSLKEELMFLNQGDFIREFGNYYRSGIDPSDEKFKIGFEKSKITAIGILNGIESQSMENLSRMYRLYNLNRDKDRKDILDILMENLDDREYIESQIGYFNELAGYLYKMRKSRINPKALIIDEYIMPNVFEYEKGEWFNHSLLNKCLVLDKKIEDKFLYVQVQTKSGIYNFRKPIRR